MFVSEQLVQFSQLNSEKEEWYRAIANEWTKQGGSVHPAISTKLLIESFRTSCHIIYVSEEERKEQQLIEFEKYFGGAELSVHMSIVF